MKKDMEGAKSGGRRRRRRSQSEERCKCDHFNSDREATNNIQPRESRSNCAQIREVPVTHTHSNTVSKANRGFVDAALK